LIAYILFIQRKGMRHFGEGHPQPAPATTRAHSQNYKQSPTILPVRGTNGFLDSVRAVFRRPFAPARMEAISCDWGSLADSGAFLPPAFGGGGSGSDARKGGGGASGGGARGGGARGGGGGGSGRAGGGGAGGGLPVAPTVPGCKRRMLVPRKYCHGYESIPPGFSPACLGTPVFLSRVVGSPAHIYIEAMQGECMQV